MTKQTNAEVNTEPTKGFFIDYRALQLEIKNPIKDTTVKMEFKSGRRAEYSYAQLPDILNDYRPLLAKHNFVLLGGITNGTVTTTLLHESGQTVNAGVPIPDYAGDAQRLGSFLSYARRYMLLSILNVAQEDNDGQSTVDAPMSEAELVNRMFKLEVNAIHMDLETLTEGIQAAKVACANYPALMKRIAALEVKYFSE